MATPNLAVQWLDNDVVEGNGVVNYWTTSDAVTGATEPAWPLGRWTLNGAALGAIAGAADPDPAVAQWTREIAADALLVYRRNRVFSNGYLAAGATFESGSRGADVLLERNVAAPRTLGEPPGGGRCIAANASWGRVVTRDNCCIAPW